MVIIIVLPVYNEELVLAKSVKQVADFCRQNFIHDQWRLVIADNNSKDKTGEIGRRLAQESAVEYIFIPQKGRGRALKAAWQKHDADVYLYMDVDLAVELPALVKLVQNIRDGYDLAIGSRYVKGSKIERSYFRDLTSIIYRLIVRLILKTGISDFQCGFKALNKKVRDNVLPQTKDNEFFLDTEMLILAEKQGYKIKEVPVNWSDYREARRKSTVNVFDTAIKYLKEVWRLKKRLRLNK